MRRGKWMGLLLMAVLTCVGLGVTASAAEPECVARYYARTGWEEHGACIELWGDPDLYPSDLRDLGAPALGQLWPGTEMRAYKTGGSNWSSPGRGAPTTSWAQVTVQGKTYDLFKEEPTGIILKEGDKVVVETGCYTNYGGPFGGSIFPYYYEATVDYRNQKSSFEIQADSADGFTAGTQVQIPFQVQTDRSQNNVTISLVDLDDNTVVYGSVKADLTAGTPKDLAITCAKLPAGTYGFTVEHEAQINGGYRYIPPTGTVGDEITVVRADRELSVVYNTADVIWASGPAAVECTVRSNGAGTATVQLADANGAPAAEKTVSLADTGNGYSAVVSFTDIPFGIYTAKAETAEDDYFNQASAEAANSIAVRSNLVLRTSGYIRATAI